MRSVLQQFEEKVTGLHKAHLNQFQLARLRLTAIYAVLLLVILFISSVVTHSFFTGRLDHRYQGTPFMPPRPVIQIEKAIREEVRDELSASLFVVNGFLFVTAVGLSYVLAGITLKPIQEAHEKQRAFLSDASHELRTPLAILQTDLENELRTTKGAAKEQIESNLEEVKRMATIVAELLLLSRLDTQDESVIHKKRINLTEAVETSIKRLEGYATTHNVSVTPPTGTQTPVYISADLEHIIQAITNVIKNGIEHNKPGGTVSAKISRIKQAVQIQISDTGVGISSSEIPKLFNRFYRTDSSRSRSLGGNGLGLSIVEAIANTYGGTVSVTSELGTGTTVTLEFPTIS